MSTPVQARSRASRERILSAAEHLLAGLPFEELTMAAVAAAAGMSVGGVYARFASKDALLEGLHARYEAYRTAFLNESFDPALWRDADLAARVTGVCSALVTLMRDSRPVLRSFLLRHWSNPQERRGEFSRQLEDIYGRAVDLLVERADEIRADRPRRAARIAVAVVAGACRDMVVMKPAPAPGAVEISDGELVAALSRAACGVLGCAPAATRKRRRAG